MEIDLLGPVAGGFRVGEALSGVNRGEAQLERAPQDRPNSAVSMAVPSGLFCYVF